MVMGLSRMDLMEKKGLQIPKTFAELQQVLRRRSTAPTKSTASSAFSFITGACRLHPRVSAATSSGIACRYHATLNSAEDDPGGRLLRQSLEELRAARRKSPTPRTRRVRHFCRPFQYFIHSSAWVKPALLSEESKVQ